MTAGVLPWAVVAFPSLAAALMAAMPARLAGWVALGGSLGTLVLAGLLLPGSPAILAGLRADGLASGLAVLSALVATAADGSGLHDDVARDRRVLSQLQLGATMLALLSASPALAWVGMEAGVVASLLAGRCTLALPGAAVGIAGLGMLLQQAGVQQPGFVLLLAGYAGVAALVPALAAPAVAAVLRGRMEAGGAEPAWLLVAGLGLVAAAGASLWRGRDGRSAGPGLALFGFGLGGAAAGFAGLVCLAAGTLAGNAAAQSAARPDRRLAQWSLAALAGLPPFGVFAGQVLVLTETVRRAPLLALPLGAAMAAVTWLLIRRMASVPDGRCTRGAAAGVWLQLAALAVLGAALPTDAAAWLRGVAEALR